jgi:hypothetical protein
MIDESGAPRVPNGNVADPGPIVNDALNVNKWAEVYGEDPENTDPLAYDYLPGRWGGNAIAAGSVALTDDATNYIVVERSTGVLSVATTNTNWNNLTSYARVARIVLASGARTDDEDFRSGPGGVHGQADLASSTAALLITEATSNRDFATTDAGAYVRFTGTGAKTASFDVSDGFSSPQEYHIANRAASGNLTLTPTGITLNAPKGGTLVLEPGDTVTVKFVDSDEADVFGSTEAA